MNNQSENMKRAGQRYMRGMMIAAALYTGIIFASVYAIENLHPPHWLVIVAALAPLAPALLMLRTYLVFMGEVDELQRRMQSEAMLIALATVGFSSFAWGFLEEWAQFPHIPLIWVLPAIIAVWGVAVAFVRLRYQ